MTVMIPDRHATRRWIPNATLSLVVVATSIVLAPRTLASLAVVAVVATAAEVLWPLHGRSRPLGSWLTDLTHAVGNRYLVLTGVFVLLSALSPAVDLVVPAWLPPLLHRAPWWAQAAVVFVSTDLASYAGHRALHRSRVLWRLHRVHHATEHLDWLATSRVHPIDLAFNMGVASLPAFMLGYVDEQPWLVTFLFLYPFLLHSNARLRLPGARWILVYPAFHHWHHAAAEAAHDANFGAILSVWDRLFHTAYEPDGYPDRYGIGDARLATGSYLDHLASPFRAPSNLGREHEV